MSQDFHSLGQLVHWRVRTTPNRDAFYSPKPEGGWRTWSWQEVGQRVDAIGAGLRALGLEDEQRVGILCSTRIEWMLADLGILVAGGATTTIYPNLPPEDCAYILGDSNTVICFAEDAEQVAKLQEVRGELPTVRHVISLVGEGSEDGWVISLAELESRGLVWSQTNDLNAISERISADQLATLIYTSGTTGKPKGVELTHDCWLYTAKAMDDIGVFSADDKQYLWLPMSHSFGKVLEVAVVRIGIPTAIDGRIPNLIENLSEVRPTFMAAAPRIFEKVYNRVITTAREGGSLRFGIFRWALGVGREVSQHLQRGEEPSAWLALKGWFADKLVLSKLRDRFGGRIRYLISGSAPLSREMAEFFHAAGMLILEGYGLTESSAATFVNRPDSYAFGTVGLPMPGTELKFDEEDGEILLKSRGVMRGYHNLPEATAEALEEGWLRTGDIGELDERGRLKITDRKKDLIKTSGGKYVAPQLLEGRLKAQCPYLSQVLVHGNARNYCTALVTLDADVITKWAAEQGLSALSASEIAGHEATRKLVQKAVDETNSTLARFETIKKFAILPEDFSLESGELTASLKVKRKVVETKYKEILDGFYEDALASV